MAKADVHITDAETGETRIYHDDLEWEDEDRSCTFLWSEGNYACDCNRSLHFQWAAGLGTRDYETECGDERYFVRILDRETGAVLYEDAVGP